MCRQCSEKDYAYVLKYIIALKKSLSSRIAETHWSKVVKPETLCE